VITQGEHLVMLDAIIKHEDEFEIDDDSSDDPNPSSIEKRLKNIEDVYENFIKDGECCPPPDCSLAFSHMSDKHRAK
jgi:hypothetical protein